MSPETTTPTREELLDALDVIESIWGEQITMPVFGMQGAVLCTNCGGRIPGEHKSGCPLEVLNRAKQRLASEPTASEPVTPEKFSDDAVQWLCELPDRTSPEDWPEACLVTGEELHAYLVEQVSALLATSTGARGAVVEEIAK